MKLTGEPKNQVEKAESKDEKKSLIENAGLELTDDELSKVAGGEDYYVDNSINKILPAWQPHNSGTPDFNILGDNTLGDIPLWLQYPE